MSRKALRVGPPQRTIGVAGVLALAGFVGLLLDLLLVFAIEGFWLQPRKMHVVIYLVTAVVLGGGLLTLRRLDGEGWPVRGGTVWACGLLAVTLPGLAEGVADVLPVLPWIVVLGVAFVVGSMACSRVGRWIGRPDAAVLLTSAAIAWFVAMQRSLPGHVLEAEPLVSSAALLVLYVGLGILIRREQERSAWVVGLGGALLLLALFRVQAASPVGEVAADPGSGSVQQRDNLLLLVVDTLRRDTFYEVLDRTPEGDRLRRALGEGSLLASSVASSSWTAPSMGSMMTGLEPPQHGLVGTSDRSRWRYKRLSDAAPTLAERFADLGYDTRAWVTNVLLNEGAGVARGFGDFELLLGPTERLPLVLAWRRAGWVVAELYVEGRILTRRWRGALPGLGGSPFFAWLHFMDPHRPIRRHDDLPQLAEESLLADDVRGYRREVRYAVRELAACIEALAGSALDSETWVVLVSDHGEMLSTDRPFDPDPAMRKGHGHGLYEALVHVPLVVRPPSGRQVPAIEVPVAMVDLPDLLTALVAGTPLPPSVGDGREPSVLLGTYNHFEQTGLRSDRWKLIRDREGGVRLYDVFEDVTERDDLAPRRETVTQRLLEELARREAAVAPAESGDVALDDWDRGRLRALGYVP